MQNLKIIPYLFFALLLTACQSEDDKRLAYALQAAGENRHELEKVLEHYRHDTLKLKAGKNSGALSLFSIIVNGSTNEKKVSVWQTRKAYTYATASGDDCTVFGRALNQIIKQ